MLIKSFVIWLGGNNPPFRAPVLKRKRSYIKISLNFNRNYYLDVRVSKIVLKIVGEKGMVLLKPGEKLLLQDRAAMEGYGKGTLFLTNNRVIFEATTGLISKKTEIVLILGLGAIEDVKVEGLISKKLVIEGSDERTGRIDRYKFSVPNPSAWEVSIKSAIQSM